MSDDSDIEWTDATWPITVGCDKCSDGCKNCYAMRSVHRVNLCQIGAGKPPPYKDLVELVTIGGRRVPRWTGVVQFFPERLAMPLRWKRPRRIFVSSQSDLFHHDVTNEQIAAVFGVMAAAPRHTFQVLTKRAGRMRAWFEWARRDFTDQQRGIACAPNTFRAMLDAAFEVLGQPSKPVLDAAWHAHDDDAWPLANVWIGVSVENQAAADERVPELLATPAAVRWISAEPLLGPLNLNAKCPPFYAPHLRSDRISWIVAGCESGPGARPCDVAWLRSLRYQCAAAGVAYFLKQAVGVDGMVAVLGAGPGSHRKAGGVIGLPYLDGVQHAEFPVVAPPEAKAARRG